MNSQTEIYLGDNLSCPVGAVVEITQASDRSTATINGKPKTRLQGLEYWNDDGSRRLGAFVVTRKDGRAPGDVGYWGVKADYA